MTIQSSFVAQTAYFVALTCASFCTALADEASRPTPDWSFAKLEQRSTAIVIVEVLSTRDANESDAITPLKGLEKNVAGVVTRFRILSTLKGTLDTKEINVKHFREVPVNGGYMGNGPCFVDFAPYIPEKPNAGDGPSLILYLRKNDADDFEFTTGHVDPLFSVKQLRQIPLQWPDDKRE